MRSGTCDDMARRPRHVTNAISRLAAAAGLSDRALAARAAISRSQLNRIKNRRTMPRVDTAMAIARALDVPVRAVFALRGRA
jgi:transcriptional regulator with XRE-family HTH domain